jgi:hypothetical protein
MKAKVKALSTKQRVIVEALKAEMSVGKALEEATRELLKTKRFNHLSVRRAAQVLAKDLSKLERWTKGLK